jgi:hypothetical protein
MKDQAEKPAEKPTTYADAKKKFEEIKAALGRPPYTVEQVKDLLDSNHEVAVNAREAIVWLAGDFVNNWEAALVQQRKNYT